jgi:hypothetical protein
MAPPTPTGVHHSVLKLNILFNLMVTILSPDYAPKVNKPSKYPTRRERETNNQTKDIILQTNRQKGVNNMHP